jgi:hypothetical protein
MIPYDDKHLERLRDRTYERQSRLQAKRAVGNINNSICNYCDFLIRKLSKRERETAV